MTLKKFLKKKKRQKQIKKKFNQKRNNSVHLKLYKKIIMAKEAWRKAVLEQIKKETLENKEKQNEIG